MPHIATPAEAGLKLVTWGCRGESSHDDVSHIQLAKRTASLLGAEYCGRLEDYAGGGPLYCVPCDTLCGAECEQFLGKVTESAILGGWVPYKGMATKAIAHPLAPGEAPPVGWPEKFVSSVVPLTLTGFTALTGEGAMVAGKQLLELGEVRIKAVNASGGTQQHIARSLDELAAVVARFGGRGELDDSLVLEENLADVHTYGLGRIRVGNFAASYIGEQDLTPNNEGEMVYGGSRLSLVRGGFADLMHQLDGGEAEMCRLAMEFDRLADMHLGLVASRRNYDVVTGINVRGERKRAVLEQSWRVGGATGAELAALDLFARDASVSLVRAATVERYGAQAVLPPGAEVYFRGTDPAAGPVVKYTIVQEHH